jgi:dipeptidyl aminopeptidase/acylaminoacyl peptidase
VAQRSTVLRAVRTLPLSLFALAIPLTAQDEPSEAELRLAAESYTTPESVIAEAVLAPRWENVSLSGMNATGDWFLHTVSDGPPTLAIFAKPHLNLGALQIDPAADRHRRLTTRNAVGYQFVSAEDGRRVDVEVPREARVTGASWSPDGRRMAFMAHFSDRTHIYVADLDGDSRQVTRDPILATHVQSIEWTGDSRHIVTVLPPEDRTAMPVEPAIPTTPMVRRTTDVENRLRTYFDLLEDPYEKSLVEYFSTGQVALIEVDSRRVTRIGEPRMITSVSVSPDGEHFRVRALQGDLSYIVPTTSSADEEFVMDREGTVLVTLDEREAREGARNGGNGDGGNDRRAITWHPEGGMVFLQMEPREEDEGDDDADDAPEDEEEEDPRMDRVVRWMAPFGEEDIEVLYATEDRISQFGFDEEVGTLFLTRGNISSSGNGTQTVHAVRMDDPSEEHLIVRRRGGDVTKDPGTIMTTTGSRGTSIVRTTSDGRYTFLSGTQYFEDPMVEAPRPFVDRVEIATGETERIFQSSAERYETVRGPRDRDMNRIVVSRESADEVAQGFLVELESGAETQLTRNVDHTPSVTAARRETVMIERPDGFTSKVEVTMPVGWEPGDPAPPAMFWFYPREYTDQESYDRGNIARFNRNDFPNLGTRSMEILTLSGYAVVDPDLPIIGDSDQPNDSYILDLRNTLATVIDSLDARGLADRGRLGLGGHSYGAFGTANAMVNTPFFKAGDRGRRELQPLPHPRRLPARAAPALGGGADLHRDVALLRGGSPDRVPSPLPRDGRPTTSGRTPTTRGASSTRSTSSGRTLRCTCTPSRTTVRRRGRPSWTSGRGGRRGSTCM